MVTPSSFSLPALVLLIALASAPSALAVSTIAPPTVCPDQTAVDAPVAVQEKAMRCMTDYARKRLGLAPLAKAKALNASADGKSGDILRCDSFSHTACGRDFTYWLKATGYLPAGCWRAAENIGQGTGGGGSVRSIFSAWMRSPGHRRNLLGKFAQIGVGLRIGELAGVPETHVWTQHFGSRC